MHQQPQGPPWRVERWPPIGAPRVLATAALALAAMALAWQRVGRDTQPPVQEPRVGPDQTAPSPEAQLSYTVAPGDTLSAVARRFGTTVQELMAANDIRNPDAIYVGQVLQLRLVPEREGPAIHLIPDGELVFGPAYLDFDTRSFVAAQGGYLAQYSEPVDGQDTSGADIVDRISREFSVGPRVLLALLEATSGWVTGTPGDSRALEYPAGLEDPLRRGLWWQLSWLADRLNGGYYDWKTRDRRILRLADGTILAGHPSLGAASFAVQRALASQSTEAQLVERLLAFGTTYRTLFGDPWSRQRPASDRSAPSFPPLTLPWPPGERWWFTGGPHGGWADGSAWAAVDFVPDEEGRGCFISDRWATAVADGVVVDGGPGQLWLDLDGDGRIETGPTVLYLHLASVDRAPDGAHVTAGQRLGHPSCEGGMSDATHLHLARRFDGEWLAADGSMPLVLGRWQVTGGTAAYEGAMVHADGRRRQACECRQEGYNDVAW